MLSSGPFKRMASSLYNLCTKPLVSGVYSLSILRLYGGLMFRLGFILWLLANNKTLTRSNLSKRQHLDGLSCLFCGETETVHHLFFGCCVATSMLLCGATYLKFFIQTWVSILNQWLGGGLVTKRMPFLIPVVPHLENA